MTDLVPCAVKGCPWRGHDPYDCPLHASDEAWDAQGQLMQGIPSTAKTRHR